MRRLLERASDADDMHKHREHFMFVCWQRSEQNRTRQTPVRVRRGRRRMIDSVRYLFSYLRAATPLSSVRHRPT